jgi:hypothetical protein
MFVAEQQLHLIRAAAALRHRFGFMAMRNAASSSASPCGAIVTSELTTHGFTGDVEAAVNNPTLRPVTPYSSTASTSRSTPPLP